MRNISCWARQNKVKARLTLIILKLLLACMAYFIGSNLSELNIILPELTGITAVFLFVLIAVIYPARHKSRLSKKLFYIKQKSCDYILAASSFLMMIFFTNNRLYTLTDPAPSFAIMPAVVNIDPPTAEEILKSLEHRDKKSLTRQEKRILKQEFKKQLKVYVKSKITGKKDEAAKALLIVLTIIGALGALYLVAALSCSLSCNGSDAAALAVAILGLVGVIWGTVAIIRRISRGPKKKIAESPVQ